MTERSLEVKKEKWYKNLKKPIFSTNWNVWSPNLVTRTVRSSRINVVHSSASMVTERSLEVKQKKNGIKSFKKPIFSANWNVWTPNLVTRTGMSSRINVVHISASRVTERSLEVKHAKLVNKFFKSLFFPQIKMCGSPNLVTRTV